MISVYNFDRKFCLPKKLSMPHSKKEKKEEH